VFHDHRKNLQPRFVFIYKQASIPEATRLMREYHVGVLVVMKKKQASTFLSASSPIATLSSRLSPKARAWTTSAWATA
jgi:hypothetical protein